MDVPERSAARNTQDDSALRDVRVRVYGITPAARRTRSVTLQCAARGTRRPSREEYQHAGILLDGYAKLCTVHADLKRLKPKSPPLTDLGAKYGVARQMLAGPAGPYMATHPNGRCVLEQCPSGTTGQQNAGTVRPTNQSCLCGAG